MDWIAAVNKDPSLTEQATDWFIININSATIFSFLLELSKTANISMLLWIYSILKRDDRFRNEFKPAISHILGTMGKQSARDKERIMRTLTLLYPILGEYINDAKRIVEGSSIIRKGIISQEKRLEYESLRLHHTGSYPLHKGHIDPFITMDQDHLHFVMARFDEDVKQHAPWSLESRYHL
jgi:hypothetical protein